MTSRERVLVAAKKDKPDRTPCNFRAEEPTLKRLYDYLGYNDYDRLLEQLKIDIRYIDCIPPEEKNYGTYIENHWGERYVYANTPWGRRVEHMPGALADATSIEDLTSFPWPSIDMNDYSNLAQQCEKYDEYAIVYGFGDIFTRPSIVRGFENFLLDMYLNEDYVDFLIEKFTDTFILDYKRAFKETNGRIDIFLVMGDLASQAGPIFSLDMFDRYLAPHMTRLADSIHDMGALLMFHSCGESHDFYSRLINCGVDIIDPIQPTSLRMSPETLNAEFKDTACFHGGIDVQHILPFGNEEDVRREVRRYIDAFKDSGYICCSAHYMQHDTPPENILALYDEIYRYSKNIN